MQGGPASSALVVALIGNLSSCPAHSSWLAGIADDFIVIGRSEAAVVGAGRDLTQYLTGCPLGPTEFHTDLADVRDAFCHVGCLFMPVDRDIETWIPETKLDRARYLMIDSMRNPRRGDCGKRPAHFARKAIGPYPWAPEWQREYLREEAESELAKEAT